jgi:hypothetical protein
MMHTIDLSSVLRQTVACDLYSNLVTRPTGAAVRGQIELLLRESGDERALTVIDFSQVSIIDFSCADEVVAKLLLRYGVDDPPREAYFLFRGVTEDHRDAIESVLERHGLALALEIDDGGGVEILGALTDDERRTWNAVYRIGPVSADDVARETGCHSDDALIVLGALCRRRLVMPVDDQFVAVGRLHG